MSESLIILIIFIVTIGVGSVFMFIAYRNMEKEELRHKKELDSLLEIMRLYAIKKESDRLHKENNAIFLDKVIKKGEKINAVKNHKCD